VIVQEQRDADQVRCAACALQRESLLIEIVNCPLAPPTGYRELRSDIRGLLKESRMGDLGNKIRFRRSGSGVERGRATRSCRL